MRTTDQPRHRPPTVSTPTPAAHDTEILDTMDDLLQEIDDLLEQENEFLQRYRQRGGE